MITDLELNKIQQHWSEVALQNIAPSLKQAAYDIARIMEAHHRKEFEVNELKSELEDLKKEIRNRDEHHPETTFLFIPGMTMETVKRKAIIHTLKFHKSNRTYTAKTLKISLRTLRIKIAQYIKEGTAKDI